MITCGQSYMTGVVKGTGWNYVWLRLLMMLIHGRDSAHELSVKLSLPGSPHKDGHVTGTTPTSVKVKYVVTLNSQTKWGLWVRLVKWLVSVLRWLCSLRSVKADPKCGTRDTEVCKSIAIIRKHIAIVRRDWMAAACKLLSFANVILSVSPCCLALCYPWLWSRWVWLTEGMPLRPSAACFSEQERGFMPWATWATTHHLWRLMRKVRWLDLWLKLWEYVVD